MGRIFVGNLDFSASEEEVRELVEEHGSVVDVSVPVDWETGFSRGFAVVEVEDRSLKRAVRELDGTEMDGRELTARELSGKPPKFDTLSSSSD